MNYCLPLLMTLGFFLNGYSQVVTYDFNGNINDQTNTNHAIYLKNGATTTDAPAFASSGAATRLVLSPIHGLRLPNTVRAAIDTTKSLELAFSFRVTDLAAGKGEKLLWSCSAGDNADGFLIKIQHDEFSTQQDYNISFSYADGGFDQGIPNHAGHDATNIGYQFVGDVVNVRLVMDFEHKTWSSNVNGNYVSQVFNNNYPYDWQVLMQSLKANTWYIGWKSGQKAEMIDYPENYTSTIEIDSWQLFSPRQAGNISTVQAALQAMTAHVNGTAPLTTAQRMVHLNDLYQNYFNNHSQVAVQVFDFINAYEANYPPVYENRNTAAITDLLPESQLLIFLQQSIFDNEYTLGNVAALQGIKYEFAQLFPGSVKATAPRLSNASVVVDGSHSYNPAARTVHDLDEAKRPTGYYAAPGEIITITIPAGAIVAGLQVQIGAHTADHSSLSVTNRFKRIAKRYPLAATTTQIVSPFGGGIYILVPLNSSLDWITIGISGAVKSPYFSWRTGRQTTPSAWAIELAARQVEWADLESDNYMMTMPVAHLTEIGLADPSSLMTQWDNIIKGGFDYVGGRPTTARKRSEYFTVDSRLPHDVFGVGYPQAMGESKAPFGPFDLKEYYPTQVLKPNFWNSELNTTFHEMGHATAHPTLPDEVESIVHLPAVYTYNQLYGLSIDEAFKFSSGEYFLLHEAAIDWMIVHNFRNNNDMGCDPTMDPLVCDELRYQHRSFAKYVTMAKLFGWQSVHNMNKVFYDAWTANGPNSLPVGKDEVIKAASNSNGINMGPLFHFWGQAPSVALKSELEALPTSPKIFNELIGYYKLIPQNQAAFLPWKDLLLSKKDPVHFSRINDSYDQYDTQNYAAQMRSQVCSIMQSYYPGNNFCTSPTLTANNDTFTGIAQGSNTPSAFINDDAYGTIDATSDLVSTPTVVNNGGLVGIAFNADGTATIPVGTAAGIYNVRYSVCLKNSPSVCSQAVMTLTVTGASVCNAGLVAPKVR